MGQNLDVSVGSNAALTASNCDFRYSPGSGLKSDIAGGPFGAKGLNRSRGRALRRAAWPWMDDGSVLPDDEGPEAYLQNR
jgi:hypothetical protein